MNILFLYLSDIHLSKKNLFSDEKVELMIKSIDDKNKIDEVDIIVSGDLAFNGINEEYELFDSLIDKVKKKISKKFNLTNDIKFLIVPGNHDIDYNERPVDRQYIQNEFYNGKNAKKIIDEYNKKMESFFNYANKYNCFCDKGLVDIKIIEYDGFTIQFNLINTALNSKFKDNINDDDKGLHYLSDDDIKKLSKNYNHNFTITIMHHSPEWFEETSKHKLIKYINSENGILLYGHEHVNSEENIVKEDNQIKKICGGPLLDSDISKFNTLILNTESSELTTYSYVYNQSIDKYVKYTSSKRQININYKISNEYIQSIKKDDFLQNIFDFNNIFVFPDLEVVNSESGKIIENLNDFIKEIEDKKICIIDGDDCSGKTTLCKFLYLEFAKKQLPLFIDLKNLDYRKVKNISKLVYYSFIEQYNSKYYDYNSFIQEDKSKKIAIIDDANKINKSSYDLIISELIEFFGLIIIINGSKIENNLYNIAENNVDKDKAYLEICPLVNEKRKKLLNKIINLMTPNITEYELNEKIKFINNLIMNQLNLVNLNPYFIILFTQTVLNNGVKPGDSGVFNTVFESNITMMLRSNPEINVSLALLILKRLAYYIHIHKEYPVSEEVLYKIIEDYNAEGVKNGKRVKAEIKQINNFISNLISTRIINYYGNESKICFLNNTYLAYFIAKEWLRIQDKAVLLKMVDQICFGINGDILLFISYLYEYSQKYLFDIILNKANDFFDKINELNFKEENIKYLFDSKHQIRLSIPNEIEKEKEKKKIEEKERKIKKNTSIKYINIYDFDESKINDITNRFTTGYKYIELLAKTLPDFINDMDPDQIEKYIEAIYIYPNKLLFDIFEPINKTLVSDLYKLKNKLDQQNQIEYNFYIEKAISEVQNVSTYILLNTYGSIAKYVTSIDTLPALESFDCSKNYNYQLQKAMFYDCLGETEKMGNILFDLYNKNTMRVAVQNYCIRVYYKHSIYNKIKYVGNIQKQIDTFFPDFNQKNIYPSNGKEKMAKLRLKK